MKNQLLMYEYIYESVEFFRLNRQLTLRDLAVELNVSEQFLKQIQQQKNHYNLEHLFILSERYNYPIKKFFPDPVIYSQIESKKFSSKYSYKDFISKLLYELKYGGNN